MDKEIIKFVESAGFNHDEGKLLLYPYLNTVYVDKNYTVTVAEAIKQLVDNINKVKFPRYGYEEVFTINKTCWEQGCANADKNNLVKLVVLEEL